MGRHRRPFTGAACSSPDSCKWGSGLFGCGGGRGIENMEQNFPSPPAKGVPLTRQMGLGYGCCVLSFCSPVLCCGGRGGEWT